MVLLILLFFFFQILDVNSQNVPQLHVSPEVITQRGSVQLHCDVPHNVKVSQCFFYPERDDTNIKLSPSCRLSVTGSELITWTRRRSPGTFNIICYYTEDKSGISSPSPHSLPAPVTVLSQKPLLTISYDHQSAEFRFVCEIPESESVTAGFRCNLYTGENPQPFLNQTSQKRNSGKEVCVFIAQRNDVSHQSREMSCDYSLISDLTARSLMSDKYSLIRFFPSPTQPSITTEKSTAYFFTTTTRTTSITTTPPPPPPPSSPSTVKEKSSAASITTETPTAGSLFMVITVSGVCVLLAGLMIICLCMCIRKQRTERHKLNMSHCGHDSDEVYTEVMYTFSPQQL